MKLLLCAFFILMCFSVHCVPHKQIALTLDDSPRAAGGYLDGPTRAKKLLSALKAHDVPQVAFFSVSTHLNGEGLARLQAYNDAGHLIANHTHDHPDFNTVTLTQYRESFTQADRALASFSNKTKLFRFPYLREGDSIEKRDGMRKMLTENGYRNGYVTVNTYDWYIENQFQNAIKAGHNVDLARMSRFYVDMMMQSIEAYDALAVDVLGRSPKHTLLLHEMDITALFIGDLITALKQKGWQVISPLDAYQDEIATFVSDEILPYNPGRIGEIARRQGVTKGLWPQALQESYLDQQFKQQVLQSQSSTK